MISIIMSYFNRKNLLLRTLKSIKKSSVTDYEIIIVDDCSSEEHRLEDILKDNPLIKLIRIESEKKWWINPCVTYNLGFKKAKGDIILIQNPECYHYGDILNAASKINLKQYFSFACYSLDEATSKDLKEIQINNRPAYKDGDLAWYNHSFYRPKGYHFCSAITKQTLFEEMEGGFDERYAYGIAYDDDEFLKRIAKNNIEITIIDKPFVLHQWHQSVDYNKTGQNGQKLVEKNKILFENNFYE